MVDPMLDLSFTPLLGGFLGGTHSGVLAITVRTDRIFPVGRGGRGSSDPLRLVRCDQCNRPIKDCVCVTTIDY